MKFWLREEARETERRTPLVPKDAAALIADGAEITVERNARRIFDDAAYAQAGCTLADPGTWIAAPRDTLVLGVKELPARPDTLAGAYAHFAHLYKDQRGWQHHLGRFAKGGGTLYDLEYLTDENGVRVAAFGYWAGWLGAALGVQGWLLRLRGETPGPVSPRPSREAFLDEIRAMRGEASIPRAVVIGAKGRSGQGASDLLGVLGIPATLWDREETVDLDRATLLDHDILVNCVLLRGPGLTLLTPDDLGDPALRLGTISDVACDPLSDFNPLPVYDAPTGWDEPFLPLRGAGDVWLTAIDNLPSLLPREASEDFSAQLLGTLRACPDGVAWRNAEAAFDAAVARL